MAQPSFDFQPIIIIGAARSGTNMLRDMLTQIDGVGTWPCDEINYIWRHHNARIPHDELTADDATPQVVRDIRGAFRKMASRSNSCWLVEKTCANSLRVNFVDAVIPEARYIFVVRDGRDVVLSAMKRWKAPLDLRYVLKKIPFVPLSDIPYYAMRYLGHRIYRLTSREQRLSTWGPQFIGMREMLAQHPLDEVCALQWARSVQSAQAVLRAFSADRVYMLRYEEIVTTPQVAFEGLLRFLHIPASANTREEIVEGVFADSAGVWKTKMAGEQRVRIETLVGPTLNEFGYQTEASSLAARAA